MGCIDAYTTILDFLESKYDKARPKQPPEVPSATVLVCLRI